jgi:hypothetical protein
MNLFKTLKKLYKTQYFFDFELTKTTLTYRDCNGTKYSLQADPGSLDICYFRIGHSEDYRHWGLTYESEYNKPGWIESTRFIDHWKIVRTDNPDYVLRASLSNLNN